MTQPSTVPSQAPSEILSTPATSVAGAAVVAPSTVASDAVAPGAIHVHTTQPTPALNWSNSTASTPGLSDTLHVAGGLALVIAFIFGLGLLIKRLASGPMRKGRQRVLKTIDTQAVGSKERIAVMEINDTWLVVGISPQGISTLHSMPRPDDAPAHNNSSDEASPRTGMPFTQALREAARQSFGRKNVRDRETDCHHTDSRHITDRDSHDDRNDHA